nr:DUF397 domain-containing protein [Micromonospora sp. A200]
MRRITELADSAGPLGARDSTDRQGRALTFPLAAWTAFAHVVATDGLTAIRRPPSADRRHPWPGEWPSLRRPGMTHRLCVGGGWGQRDWAGRQQTVRRGVSPDGPGRFRARADAAGLRLPAGAQRRRGRMAA